MARIRTIKPEFFLHEGLYDLEEKTGLPIRLAFAGLWTQADREGRFSWRPRKLKTQILPYDPCDFAIVLAELANAGFIVYYRVDDTEYGFIPSWSEHQYVNSREPESNIPAPQEDTSSTVPVLARNIPVLVENIPARVEGKGKEGKGKEEEEHSDAVASVVVDSKPKLSAKEAREQKIQKYIDDLIRAAPIPEPLVCPRIDLEWREWLRHRFEIGKPLQPTGARKQLQRLAGMGAERALAAMSHSMAQGWEGIFEAKSTGRPLAPVHDPHTVAEDLNQWRLAE